MASPNLTKSVGRALLSAAILVAAACGALFLEFVAYIEWSGCFIECSRDGGNPLKGATIAVLAALTLAAGPALVSVVYASAGWRHAAQWTLGIGLFLALAVAGS